MPMLDADAEWVGAAYAAHGTELYRFALRSLGDTGLAEEAVQSTYLRAWRNADRYDEELGSLRTWLFAIIRNVVIDVARARRLRPVTATGDAAPETQHPDDDIDRMLLAWQVEEALRRLSDEHRVVLVETYYRSRPYAAVAAELGVPVGTVKSRVYYALRQLRLALEELGSLRTWLFAIIRNVVIDVARARRLRPVTATGDAAPEAQHADDDIDRMLLAWQVEEALRRLSDEHRVVLVETYYRSRPYAAVAAELGVPVGTVKSRVYYALRQLRLALEELGWSEQ